MQVAATFGWNAVYGMKIEKPASYVYENGPWRLGVTDVPTHEIETEGPTKEKHRDKLFSEVGRYGTFFEAIKNIVNTQYNVDISMYPGIVVDIPDIPPFGEKT